MDLIADKKEDLQLLCGKHKVERLYLFGSALTKRFDPERSDLDFLVQMEPLSPLERGEHLMALWSALEALFARRVDLLTEQSLQNPYLKKEVEETKKLVYDRQSQKVSL
jgi:predicted nucleotidyltransferase